jgi:hypothetical protein
MEAANGNSAHKTTKIAQGGLDCHERSRARSLDLGCIYTEPRGLLFNSLSQLGNCGNRVFTWGWVLPPILGLDNVNFRQ